MRPERLPCSPLYSIESTISMRTYDASNRQRAAAETRDRIAVAAARLFERDGYAETSIQTIATEAGVAVPTVYASLRNKAGVLRAVVERSVRAEGVELTASR